MPKTEILADIAVAILFGLAVGYFFCGPIVMALLRLIGI